MCGFDCPCDPKVCDGGCPGECKDTAPAGRPSDAQMLAYLEGQHGPPSAEAVQIIQDNLERDVNPDPNGGGKE